MGSQQKYFRINTFFVKTGNLVPGAFTELLCKQFPEMILNFLKHNMDDNKNPKVNIK